jgi:hypothetical protein
MVLTFMNYAHRNNESIKKLKTNIRNLQLECNIRNNILANADATGMKKTERTRLNNRIKSIENTVANHTAELDMREFLAVNPDDLVKEYLLTLPANITRIELEDMCEKHSLTTIPDLSRFTCLTHLVLTNNRILSSGFECLPTTLERLDCYKTNVQDTAWIPRLTNLESLDLRRNDLIREFPDLSGMTNLTNLYISELNLKRLPNMPLDKIAILRVPIQGLQRYYKKFEYHREVVIRNNISFDCISAKQSSQFIRNVNRINQFDKIREELLSTAARIVLNPSRIKRLLDQSEIDLDSDWSDIFELQNRRVYTTFYA